MIAGHCMITGLDRPVSQLRTVCVHTELLGHLVLKQVEVESASLQVVPQGIEVSGVAWIGRQRHCKGETTKR